MKNWMTALALSFVLGSVAHAQQNPDEKAESNKDLRMGQAMLTIENLDDHQKVLIERTVTGDYWVVLHEGDDVAKNKLGSERAKNLDERFSAAFLRVQYELGEDPKGCDADWRLVLRGEEYRFCPKNEQKDQTIRPLFVEMRKHIDP